MYIKNEIRDTTKSLLDAIRKVHTGESVNEENLDELSKDTLKSYSKKALKSADKLWDKADKEEDKSMATDGNKYPEKQKRHMDNASKLINKWRNRDSGKIKEDFTEEELNLIESVLGEETDKDLARQYKDNEDSNLHSENIVLVAKHFGTKMHHFRAKNLLHSHKKLGYLSPALSNKRTGLHSEISKHSGDKLKNFYHQVKSLRESVELDEARGRPPKEGSAAWKARQSSTTASEPRQHIIQQLQRAKLSMDGGSKIKFHDGSEHHVSGNHASKILDKFEGLKPFEKMAFQKKVGHSHDNLKSEL